MSQEGGFCKCFFGLNKFINGGGGNRGFAKILTSVEEKKAPSHLNFLQFVDVSTVNTSAIIV